MKKLIVLISVTMLSLNASAQYYGFGFPCTPMGIAIQAQSIAIQQLTNDLICQIQAQTVIPIGGYVPMVPVVPCVQSVPVASSDYSSGCQSAQSGHAINCPSCNNSGKCSYCNGTGQSRTGGMGLNTLDPIGKCSHCGGSGICPICHGNHM